LRSERNSLIGASTVKHPVTVRSIRHTVMCLSAALLSYSTYRAMVRPRSVCLVVLSFPSAN